MFTALIVEDEPLMRDYLMQNLTAIHSLWETAGCARDGVEAMALLKEKQYDLVITDIKMPRMDGLELATSIAISRIRTLSSSPATASSTMPGRRFGPMRRIICSSPFRMQSCTTR